jgi:hypothetical protein
LVTANLFVVIFVGQEKYLYSWDLAHYWTRVVGLTATLATDPYRSMQTVIRSVRYDDYNYLPVVPLVPLIALFGPSRLTYVLSITNVLALGAAVSFGVLHLAASRLSGYASPILPLISAGVVLLSPPFWSPILSGYPDVGGLVIVNLVLLLHLRASAPEGRVRDRLLIALLIPSTILFRRWYAYWAVSFYAALVLERCLALWRGRLPKPWTALFTIGAQAVLSLAFLAAVAPVFTARIATTSYSDLYSAYRFSSSLLESIGRVVDYFGLLSLGLFVAGVAQAARHKATRHIAVLLLVQWVIIVYAFSRTQDFGSQHFYLLLPPMLLGSALFITRLVAESRVLATWVVFALLVLNAASAFSGGELPYRSAFRYVFTGIRHPPLVREDIGEFDRMFGVLREMLTNPDDRIYVLASSEVLNSSILGGAHLSLGRHGDISRKVLTAHDVDLRDGFPERLLRAAYIVVADPIQYHLRPADQRVVGIPAEHILAGRGIGTSLAKLPYAFDLDKGVKAYLYRKTRPFSDSDLNALSDMLRHYYPDRPSVFQLKTPAPN